jgi:uncharacterized repeat protein (TIGR03803 family)
MSLEASLKNFIFLPVLVGILGLIPANQVTAQTFKTLYSFTGGSDGADPQAGLILSGNTLYGTAVGGGSYGDGTLFAVNTDGTDFTNVYSFTGGIDGGRPVAGLLLSSNTLYGTAQAGGSSGGGTVFAVNTDGTGFTNLHSFTAGSDGDEPLGALLLSGGTLYGTTPLGGTNGYGTVFGVNTDGTGFTVLYGFYAFPNSSDGLQPFAGLLLSGNTLYGTTANGGTNGDGTVFAVNIDGTSFTVLYSFTNGSDGSGPQAGLILSGNTLYGTALYGGSSDSGTVFAVNTDGTGFRTLHSFTNGSDGALPHSGLILSGNTLYGTASEGASLWGTVFAVNTDATGFTTLYSFTGGSDGGKSVGSLLLSGSTLYGTTRENSGGDGTVFALTLPLPPPPQLTIIDSGANVILTWPTNAIGFTLQSTTNLVSSAVWTTNSSPPVIVNGQNTVTNPISGPQMFFRLSQYSNNTNPPPGLAFIPAGSFMMGDTLDGEADAIPTNVTVSAFYMDVNLVSYSQWQSVYNWATNNGYGFDFVGAGKAANHPVQTVNWYDAVKWSNARSQQAGLTPVYYADAGLTQVYTNGDLAPCPNWGASGYRLPTEAEWEKAARGGLSGQRFPWGNTISESQANYSGAPSLYSYDLGPYDSFNTNFDTGAFPYSSPVGNFAANGYGLYDMAGNVYEWCWDWYGTPYAGGSDPRGPASGGYRVVRGGSFSADAPQAACAARFYYEPPYALQNGNGGFRCVRGL